MRRRQAVAALIIIGGLATQVGTTSSSVSGPGLAGQPCTRQDYDGGARWSDGEGWRCRYQADYGTFVWAAAGAPTSWEPPASAASAPSAAQP